MTTPHRPPAIAPDTKDWTWVLDRPCPECGYDSAEVPREEIGERLRRNAETWPPLLGLPGATTRADPTTWACSEYAAHVRDVHRVFGGRLQAMLTEDDPLFDDWDQDAAAVAGRYAELDPADVARDLVAGAAAVAATYDAVADGPGGAAAWARPGRRSNGSVFTVETLGRYHLHDVEHHAWDVRGAARTATVEAYEAHAAGYRTGTTMTPEVVATASTTSLDGWGRGRGSWRSAPGPVGTPSSSRSAGWQCDAPT